MMLLTNAKIVPPSENLLVRISSEDRSQHARDFEYLKAVKHGYCMLFLFLGLTQGSAQPPYSDAPTLIGQRPTVTICPTFEGRRLSVKQAFLPWQQRQKTPLFCRLEDKLHQRARLPIFFRLGSLDYVNALEGKGYPDASLLTPAGQLLVRTNAGTGADKREGSTGKE